jgi:hypothetical protein
LSVSFKQENGEWAGAINMGERVNSTARELRPAISPNEKYFFSSNRSSYKTHSEIPTP